MFIKLRKGTIKIFGYYIYITKRSMRPRVSRKYDLVIPKKKRKEIHDRLYERANGKCEICGKPLVTYKSEERRLDNSGYCHHIVPLSMGGPWGDMRNLLFVCHDCHKTIHSNPVSYGKQIETTLEKWKEEGIYDEMRKASDYQLSIKY